MRIQDIPSLEKMPNNNTYPNIICPNKSRKSSRSENVEPSEAGLAALDVATMHRSASAAIALLWRDNISTSIFRGFVRTTAVTSSLDRLHLLHKYSGFSSEPEDDYHLEGLADSLSQQQSQQISSADDDATKGKDKLTQKLTWLSSILEQALNFYRRALPPERVSGTASTRSLVDIATSLNRSNYGMQHWNLGDLTLGLYLLSLQHASEMVVDTINGEVILSKQMVRDLLYHVEIAKGAYLKNSAAVARVSLLRESHILKFINKASVMQPAYYVAIDHKQKLVILCIRGTHSIHDLITNLASYGEEESFDDGNVHYGVVQAARWFLSNEVSTLKLLLARHVGYGLRLVGHSLGGATASMLAMMMRKNAIELLGICPDRISAVGIATPPCVSKNLAVGSSGFITTLVLQDDVIPRMCASTMIRLRNEILLIDWTSVLKGEDKKGILDLVASSLQALSSVQDVARKCTTYARRRSRPDFSGNNKERVLVDVGAATGQTVSRHQAVVPVEKLEELFSPGLLFHVTGQPCCRLSDNETTETREGCVLVKGYPDARFGRIILSGTMLSDHKCDNYYYSLRDVLKGL